MQTHTCKQDYVLNRCVTIQQSKLEMSVFLVTCRTEHPNTHTRETQLNVKHHRRRPGIALLHALLTPRKVFSSKRTFMTEPTHKSVFFPRRVTGPNQKTHCMKTRSLQGHSSATRVCWPGKGRRSGVAVDTLADPGARAPLAPKIFSKSCSFQAIVRGKPLF